MLTQTPGCTVTTALGSSESTLWLCRCLQELNNRLAAEISRLRTLLTGDAGGEAAGSPLTQGKDAYEYVMKALKAQPSNVAFLMDYARVAVLLGDCDTALRTWSKARDLAPSKIELYPLKIDIYIAAGRYNDAVSFVNGLMSGDPANEPFYHSLKAYAASARKDFLAEEKERFAAMKTSGYSWEYTRDYAVFLKSRNRSNEAAEFFRIAAENCPNDRVREEIMALESGE